ncbi:MAG: GNAT family N-acetyltransferase, partial [Acidimicrobiia bacterium]
MSEIIVREARPEEYEEVGHLTVESYREYEEGFGQFWGVYAAELQDVAGRAIDAKILVAEEDSSPTKLIGAVAYYPSTERGEGDFQSDWGLIRVLAVHPGHRGKGIGKLLT